MKQSNVHFIIIHITAAAASISAKRCILIELSVSKTRILPLNHTPHAPIQATMYAKYPLMRIDSTRSAVRRAAAAYIMEVHNKSAQCRMDTTRGRLTRA